MKKVKRRLLRVIAGAVLFAVAFALDKTGALTAYWRLFGYIPAYLVIGGDVLWKAVRNIFRGKVFDENFLMSLATVGAFCTAEYGEAVAVMLFYQVGELFQAYAVGRSRRSISELMDIRPDYANIMRDGQLVQVEPDAVQVGDVIVVKSGERVPLDGIILSGQSSIDTSAMTGESMPREVIPGDGVFSGGINLNGMLTIKVTKEFGQSTVAKVLELVENASEQKASAENFITRFARIYTPTVVIGAVLLSVIPSLVTGAWAEWIHRALTFLVISCPCALVISVPLSFFGGIGGASKAGVLVKGGNYLEALAKAEIVVMDKTGTLTKGTFEVQQVEDEQLLEISALAEYYCDHPIAASIKRAYGKTPDLSRIQQSEVLAGYGVRAIVDGHEIYAGNQKLMKKLGQDVLAMTGTNVYVVSDGIYRGCIRIADTVKPTAAAAIQALRRCGVKRTVMLTGDSDNIGREVASELGIDEVYTQLLPADKVEKTEELFSTLTGGKLIFVGDGINDAPVIARADVGVAMGGLGSDAAIEAADVVIMNDDPSKLAQAIGIARRTLRIVRQNIVFALAVKALVLLLGATGIVGLWAAVFADVGVAVLAILNAMRALKVKG